MPESPAVKDRASADGLRNRWARAAKMHASLLVGRVKSSKHAVLAPDGTNTAPNRAKKCTNRTAGMHANARYMHQTAPISPPVGRPARPSPTRSCPRFAPPRRKPCPRTTGFARESLLPPGQAGRRAKAMMLLAGSKAVVIPTGASPAEIECSRNAPGVVRTAASDIRVARRIPSRLQVSLGLAPRGPTTCSYTHCISVLDRSPPGLPGWRQRLIGDSHCQRHMQSKIERRRTASGTGGLAPIR